MAQVEALIKIRKPPTATSSWLLVKCKSRDIGSRAPDMTPMSYPRRAAKMLTVHTLCTASHSSVLSSWWPIIGATGGGAPGGEDGGAARGSEARSARSYRRRACSCGAVDALLLPAASDGPVGDLLRDAGRQARQDVDMEETREHLVDG